MGKNKNLYVFWSGGDDAKYAAMQYARENGYLALEMTRKAVYQDRVLKKQHEQLKKAGWTDSQIWFEKELPVWEKLSLDLQNHVLIRRCMFLLMFHIKILC